MLSKISLSYLEDRPKTTKYHLQKLVSRYGNYLSQYISLFLLKISQQAKPSKKNDILSFSFLIDINALACKQSYSYVL